MANDLEKFLQQAAERLAQKTAGKGSPPKRTAPSPQAKSSAAPTSSPRSQQRMPPRPPSTQQPPITAEVIEDQSSSDSRRGSWAREAGPDPLSTIDTRPSLLEGFNQGNDRLSDHVSQVFDHQISNLRAASASLAGAPAPPSTIGMPEATGKNFLLDMLRKPDQLRAAFIASEIFKRPTY